MVCSGALCIGYSRITWAAVLSNAPRVQIDVGVSSHLYTNACNLPTPVRRQLQLPRLHKACLQTIGYRSPDYNANVILK